MNDHTKTPLKQSVPDYLNQFELTDTQLHKLQALETNALPGNKSHNKFSMFSYAAVLALCAVLVFFGLGEYKNQQTMYAIAQEVSQNHLKFKPLEVADKNLLKVVSYFDKLDFNPINSALVKGLNTQLLGGRYCSIQGNIAAQLRLQQNNGSMATLFETKYNDDDFMFLPDINKGAEPVSQIVDGQTVTLWIEHGVVMALVSPNL